MNRPHWSYSSISQYLACPLRYYFERVLGLPTASVSCGLVLGGAVHTAIADYHLGLIVNEPRSKASLHLEFQRAWIHRESDSAIAYRLGESRADLIAQGIALVDLYLESPPPQNIVGIEKQFISPLKNSRNEYLETPLIAVADLVLADGDNWTIREFKTSARAYSESDVETSLQPTCYLNAVQESEGNSPTLEYFVLVKTKTPKLQTIDAVRTEEDFRRLGDIVENIERAVKLEIFYPVESPMNCCNCPYRAQCRDWSSYRDNRRHLEPIAELAAC